VPAELCQPPPFAQILGAELE